MEEHKVDIQTSHLQTQGIMIINYRHTVDMQITATNKPKVKKTQYKQLIRHSHINLWTHATTHLDIQIYHLTYNYFTRHTATLLDNS